MINTWYWVVPLTIELLFRAVSRNKWRPSVWVGTLLYGLALLLTRALNSLWGNISSVKIAAPKPRQIAHAASMTNATHRLKPFEIVLGYSRSRRPVKVDLSRMHTLLAGVTGGGKTMILNSILIQLFSKPMFMEQAEVYLIDLKGDHKEDHLNLWEPICTRYFSISSEYGLERAISFLEELAENVHSRDSSKWVFVFIDEVASLTYYVTDPKLRERGKAILGTLSGKLRSRGSIIAATQYPRFDIIGREVTSNMERKIGLRVDSRDQAKLIFKTPRIDMSIMPEEAGEFLLKDPPKKGLAQGKSFFVNMPEEIEGVVNKAFVSTTFGDMRLRVLSESIRGIPIGGTMAGVNKLRQSSGISLKQTEIMTMKKEFAKAGILGAPKTNGTGYTVLVQYAEAMRLAKDYIAEGRWQSA